MEKFDDDNFEDSEDGDILSGKKYVFTSVFFVFLFNATLKRLDIAFRT